MYYTSLAAAKLGFGSCQTRAWQLGSRQNRVWQLPNSGLAAAKIGFGSGQTLVWQLANSGCDGCCVCFVQVVCVCAFVFACVFLCGGWLLNKKSPDRKMLGIAVN